MGDPLSTENVLLGTELGIRQKAIATTPQTITAGSAVPLTFADGADEIDNDWHSYITNPTEFICPDENGGEYLLDCLSTITPVSTTEAINLAFEINGSPIHIDDVRYPSTVLVTNPFSIHGIGAIKLQKGDIVTASTDQYRLRFCVRRYIHFNHNHYANKIRRNHYGKSNL